MKLVSTNPANNEVLGEVEISTEEEIKQKVQLARDAAKPWRDLGLEGRIEELRKIISDLASKKEELAKIATQEVGMPITQTRSDIDDALRFFNWYLDNASKYLSPEVTNEDEKTIDKVFYEPIGVVAAISPWNYPLSNFVWTCGQNLIVGNTVVFKHSEECPLFGKLLDDVISQSGLPKGVFNEVYGDGTVGDLLVHQKVDLISFTGSSKTGKYLYKVAAEKFIKAVLEMGGSAPGIIFEDADLRQALGDVFVCRFSNAGQMCDALKRLLVHQSKFDEVVEKLKSLLGNKKVGNPLDESTDIGPLVATRQLDLLEAQIKDAVDKGAKVVIGGKKKEGLNGAFYEPTLLINVTPEMRVWREEVFGPVLPIVTFNSEAKAIEMANDTDYGLGAYIFTADNEKAMRVAKEIDTGMASINGANYVNPFNPFGGNKSSGLGREHGKFGFAELTKIKVISSNK